MSGLIKHRFVLISRWHLDCAVDAAWQCIAAVRRWPDWWPNVAAVRVDNQDAPQTQFSTSRVGDAAWIDWKTHLGYGFRLRVVTTRVLPPFELEGTAEGDLIGQGLWVLEPVGPQGNDGVLITYRWDLHLNRPWMRFAAPLLRPVFAWNHFAVMRTGAHAMAQHLGCRVLRYRDYRFAPGVTDPENLRALPWREPLVLQPPQEPRATPPH
jgi:Polyketide cyclase / dehydrase and lipid transport